MKTKFVLWIASLFIAALFGSFIGASIQRNSNNLVHAGLLEGDNKLSDQLSVLQENNTFFQNDLNSTSPNDPSALLLQQDDHNVSSMILSADKNKVDALNDYETVSKVVEQVLKDLDEAKTKELVAKILPHLTLTVTKRITPAAHPDEPNDAVFAHCQSDEVPSGGGFYFNKNGIPINLGSMSTGPGWGGRSWDFYYIFSLPREGFEKTSVQASVQCLKLGSK